MLRGTRWMEWRGVVEKFNSLLVELLRAQLEGRRDHGSQNIEIPNMFHKAPQPRDALEGFP